MGSRFRLSSPTVHKPVPGLELALAMIGIWKRLSPGWLLGFAVAGGSFAAYLLSRTVGLPGFRENSWSQFLEPLGILTLIAEGLFCVVAYVVLTRRADLAKAASAS